MNSHLYVLHTYFSRFSSCLYTHQIILKMPFSDHGKYKDEDSLLINVIEEGNAMLSNLQILNLQPQVCLRDRDSAYKPINLYHKVGHGKLDMYVINPSKEAKEIREFMERWNGENSKTLGKIKYFTKKTENV